MKTIVLKSTSVNDVKQKIESTINSDFNPTLAIVFSSIEHDLIELCSFPENQIKIFGATTAGEIANDDVYKSSIVLMLLNIDEDYFKVLLKETIEGNAEEISKKASIYAKKRFKNPGILVMASGLNTDGETIVDTILKETGENTPLFGGLAADGLRVQDTWVFTNNKISNAGIIFLIIDNDKIEMTGLATSGWEAIGVEKTITKAVGNRVYTIDNIPTMDVFIKYYNLPTDLDMAAGVLGSIGAKFPLQVMRKNRPPVLRTPLYGIKEDKSLIFAGKIPQGAKVKFSVQPTFEIIDSTIDKMKSLCNKTKNAEALIMFSCSARQVALGPLMEDEVSGIRKIWNAPLVGFFTYGEIGKTTIDQTDFHNETCSLVILNEIDEEIKKITV